MAFTSLTSVVTGRIDCEVARVECGRELPECILLARAVGAFEQDNRPSTVRDLLAGSSYSFAAAGEHELKGLNGTWQLYEPVR